MAQVQFGGVTTNGIPASQQPSRSHGRGGAGNMNARSGSQLDPDALKTPTIKQATYTTGRGGTGNMAVNNPNDPSQARAAQDVEAPAAHEREPKGTYHWGRGGEGNMMTVGGGDKADRPANSKRNSSRMSLGGKTRTGSFQMAVEKGRELLGMGAKKEAKEAANESAIE